MVARDDGGGGDVEWRMGVMRVWSLKNNKGMLMMLVMNDVHTDLSNWDHQERMDSLSFWRR